MNQPIRRKLNPGFPRVTSPGTDPSPLLRRLLRHRRWSRALTAKFEHNTSVHGWRPEALVYGLQASANYVLFRNLQQFHLNSRTSDAGRPAVNHFILGQTNTLHSVQPIRIQAHGANVENRATSSGAVALRSLRRKETLLPVKRAVESFRFTPSARGPKALFSDSVLDALEIRGRTLRLEGAGPGAVPLELGRRIVRQACRVEEHPTDPPPNVLSDPLAVHRTRDFVLEMPRFVPVKEATPEVASSALGGAPLAMPFNVVQLTDEVMRQLDRRMIAARERMGKI